MNYDELNHLSDYELKELEDSMLLEREQDMQKRLRHTGGRFVLLALAVAIWLVMKYFLVRVSGGVKPQARGLFSAITFVISIAASGYLSFTIWKKSNSDVRFAIRNAVHYWPMTLFLIFGIISLIKG